VVSIYNSIKPLCNSGLTLCLKVFSTKVSKIRGTIFTLKSYSELIRAGWKLCLEKDFIASAKVYEEAFKINSKVPLNDRHKAACTYALANDISGAYTHLFIAANELKWYDIDHLKNDNDLTNIKTDKRWYPLVKVMRKNENAIKKN
jgi:hypothetical protein